MSEKYIEEFYKLTCHPDILDIVMPVLNLKKEISESFAVLKYIRSIALKNPDKKYIIYDLCAGNALTSVSAAFLFKNVYSYAVDKRERDRKWDKCRNFKYINSDIVNEDWSYLIRQGRAVWDYIPIIIGVHACRHLAKRIIEIYNTTEEAEHLILMPCCSGPMKGFRIPDIITQNLGNYMKWSLYLHSITKGDKRLVIDNHCISPKNAIIISKKDKYQ